MLTEAVRQQLVDITGRYEELAVIVEDLPRRHPD
jgi:hypothetical protein